MVVQYYSTLLYWHHYQKIEMFFLDPQSMPKIQDIQSLHGYTVHTIHASIGCISIRERYWLDSPNLEMGASRRRSALFSYDYDPSLSAVGSSNTKAAFQTFPERPGNASFYGCIKRANTQGAHLAALGGSWAEITTEKLWCAVKLSFFVALNRWLNFFTQL